MTKRKRRLRDQQEPGQRGADGPTVPAEAPAVSTRETERPEVQTLIDQFNALSRDIVIRKGEPLRAEFPATREGKLHVIVRCGEKSVILDIAVDNGKREIVSQIQWCLLSSHDDQLAVWTTDGSPDGDSTQVRLAVVEQRELQDGAEYSVAFSMDKPQDARVDEWSPGYRRAP